MLVYNDVSVFVLYISVLDKKVLLICSEKDVVECELVFVLLFC